LPSENGSSEEGIQEP